MPQRTGTHDINHLLEVENATVDEFGGEAVLEVLRADLAAHNSIVREMTAELAVTTTDRDRMFGQSTDNEMVDADEYTRAPTQVEQPGAPVDFPLERKQYAVGWTADYIRRRTPADMARSQIAAQGAHMRAVQRAFRRAIFPATNYQTRDIHIDNRLLTIRRFLNADGMSIPTGPNAESFDPDTHTHYIAAASLTDAVVRAFIRDIVEHGHGDDVRIYINQGNVAQWDGLDGFFPYQNPRLQPATTETVARGTLDMSRTDNRAIGVYDNAEIWTKPWVPLNYHFGFSRADGRKPLVIRESTEHPTGLYIAGENAAFPLQAQFLEALFGVGVWTRTNGAVLYTGGSEYVNPAL